MQRRSFATMTRVFPLPGHASRRVLSSQFTAFRCSFVRIILYEPVNGLLNIIGEICCQMYVLRSNLRKTGFSKSLRCIENCRIQPPQSTGAACVICCNSMGLDGGGDSGP